MPRSRKGHRDGKESNLKEGCKRCLQGASQQEDGQELEECSRECVVAARKAEAVGQAYFVTMSKSDAVALPSGKFCSSISTRIRHHLLYPALPLMERLNLTLELTAEGQFDPLVAVQESASAYPVQRGNPASRYA